MSRALRELLLAWAEARLAMLRADSIDGAVYSEHPNTAAFRRQEAARHAFLTYEEPK